MYNIMYNNNMHYTRAVFSVYTRSGPVLINPKHFELASFPRTAFTCIYCKNMVHVTYI